MDGMIPLLRLELGFKKARNHFSKKSQRFSRQLNAGAGEDAGEALLEREEWCLKPPVADGCESDGYGEGNDIAEEIAAETRLMVGDGEVADHQAENVKDVEAV